MGIHMYGLVASEVGKGIRDAGYCEVTPTFVHTVIYVLVLKKILNTYKPGCT